MPLWELWLWAGLRLAAIKGPRGLLPARRLGAQPTLVFASLESVLIKERVKPARPDCQFSCCRELWQGFFCCLSGATLSPQPTQISGAGLGSPGDHAGDRGPLFLAAPPRLRAPLPQASGWVRVIRCRFPLRLLASVCVRSCLSLWPCLISQSVPLPRSPLPLSLPSPL